MPQSRPAAVRSATRSSASQPVVAIGSANSPPAQTAVSTTPAVPMMMSLRGASDPGSNPRVVGQPSGVASSASRRSATDSVPGASRRSAVTKPARPSYSDGSVPTFASADSLVTIPAVNDRSRSAGSRYRAISASTGARPAMPAYRQSRSLPGTAASALSWATPGGTVSGSHGPSSSRTWSSTHDQAASPSSRYSSYEFLASLASFVGTWSRYNRRDRRR